MVASLDGFIAKSDNSMDWFDTVDHYENGVEVSKEDIEKFLKTIDCYVMGSRTYEHALALSKDYGWAYGDLPTIVVSHRKLTVERSNIELYSGDLTALVNEKLKPNYKNVWIVGGAGLTREFVNLQLADEIRISLMPIILGEGKRFFEQIIGEHGLHLKEVTPYKTGMVELRYGVKR